MDFDRNGDIMREEIPNPSPSPQPPHSMTPWRDIRDPNLLGCFLLEIRENYKENTLHELADRFSKRYIPNYPQDENMGTVAAKQYREELEERAREGDRYAVSALAGIDAGRGVQGFDDVG